MKLRTCRGFSLLEMVFSCMILSVVMLGIFGVFRLGSQTFQFVSLRQSLQAEARIAYVQLNNDLRHSTFVSVTQMPRKVNVLVPGQEQKGTQSLDRDGICFAGVEDWADSGATDPLTGFPAFDSYVVYYATGDPEGRLIRHVLRPATTGPYPYLGFSVSSSMNDNPVANSNALAPARILSKKLLDFQVRKDENKRLIDIRLRFRGHGGARPGTLQRTDETIELSLHSYPENTYPKI
jgi:hypothetical protein